MHVVYYLGAAFKHLEGQAFKIEFGTFLTVSPH
jgi:hypothetical protein